MSTLVLCTWAAGLLASGAGLLALWRAAQGEEQPALAAALVAVVAIVATWALGTMAGVL